MIASVRGTVQSVRLDGAVVEVGGVGLLVHATPTTLGALAVGSPALLCDEPRGPGGLPDPVRLR